MARLPELSRSTGCDLEYGEDVHKAITQSNVIAAIQRMLELEINRLAAINSRDFC